MLAPCGGCGRHVKADASSCPFCGTELRDIAAPPVAVGLLLGLALMGCGEKDDDDDDATASAPSSMSESSGTGEESSTGEVGEEEGSDYGGAPPRTTNDASLDADPDEPEDDENELDPKRRRVNLRSRPQ